MFFGWFFLSQFIFSDKYNCMSKGTVIPLLPLCPELCCTEGYKNLA